MDSKWGINLKLKQFFAMISAPETAARPREWSSRCFRHARSTIMSVRGLGLRVSDP